MSEHIYDEPDLTKKVRFQKNEGGNKEENDKTIKDDVDSVRIYENHWAEGNSPPKVEDNTTEDRQQINSADVNSKNRRQVKAVILLLGLLSFLLLVTVIVLVSITIISWTAERNLRIELQKSNGDLQRFNQNLTKRSRLLEDEKANLTIERDQLEAINTNLTSEKYQLKTINSNLTSERDQLEAINTNLTSEKYQLKTINSNLTSERDQLEAINTNLTSEKYQLKTINSNLTSERDQLEAINTNLTSEKYQLKTINSNLTSERDQLEAINMNLTSEKHQLKTINSNLTSERDQLEAIITNLTKERDELCSELEAIFCPHPWMRYGHSCYLIPNSEKNWQDSKQDCENRGATLAIVSNEEEQRFISSLKQRLWIGLNDLETENVWKWVNGEEVKETYWKHGQPDNWIVHGGEDCVEFFTEPDPLRNWNDRRCGDTESFICEKALHQNCVQLL